MYFWHMQDLMAGKSNQEMLFHLCESMGREARPKRIARAELIAQACLDILYG